MCACRLWSYNISSRLWTWGTLFGCSRVRLPIVFLLVAGQSTINSYGGIATYGIPTTNSPSARFGAPLVADVRARVCVRFDLFSFAQANGKLYMGFGWQEGEFAQPSYAYYYYDYQSELSGVCTRVRLVSPTHWLQIFGGSIRRLACSPM